jgi:hypothetical protein
MRQVYGVCKACLDASLQCAGMQAPVKSRVQKLHTASVQYRNVSRGYQIGPAIRLNSLSGVRAEADLPSASIDKKSCKQFSFSN